MSPQPRNKSLGHLHTPSPQSPWRAALEEQVNSPFGQSQWSGLQKEPAGQEVELREGRKAMRLRGAAGVCCFAPPSLLVCPIAF